MMSRFGKWLPAMLVVAGFALLGAPRDAHATIFLSVSVDGGPVTTFSDPNTITLPNGTNFGGLTVNGSMHTATTSGGLNTLDSSSISVINNTSVTHVATVVVGATNFSPVSTSATTSAGGNFVHAAGSSIALSWYDDPKNGTPGGNSLATPGNLIDTFSSGVVTLDPQAYSHNGGPFAVNDPNPFSMTMKFVLTLTAGSQLSSRGNTEVKPFTVVPEPGAMVLSLSGLPLLGLLCARRRRGRD